jgi:hypothetical protein
VRAFDGGEPETAGEVRVQNVEAAASEAECARLLVDDDVVAERDGPRYLRIGDARFPVDAAADEPVDALVDFGDRAAPQAKRNPAPPPRAPT